MTIQTNIDITKVFTENKRALYEKNNDKYKYRYIINEGGSRSSKSVSILQLLLVEAIANEKQIVIVMKSLADLKRTILKKTLPNLLRTICKNIPYTYNKSEQTIYFPHNQSIITFIGADADDTVLGIESDILWVDEANKMQGPTLKQLFQRCTQTIFLSYNPAGNLTSIDEIKTVHPHKTKIIYSTYHDNPFLSQEQIDELEGFKLTDYNHYLIYCLGKRAVTKESIYQHFQPVSEMPLNKYYNFIYGLDFGYHTNALSKIWYNNSNQIYLEEIIYSHEQSVTELINEMKLANLDIDIPIIADSASPMIIKEIKDNGYNIQGAKKEEILNGINYLKTLQIEYNENAKNIANELVLYRWKKINGTLVEIPEKKHDHILDSIRYGIMYLKQKKLHNIKKTKTSKYNYF